MDSVLKSILETEKIVGPLNSRFNCSAILLWVGVHFAMFGSCSFGSIQLQ